RLVMDRSVKNAPMAVFGTLARTAVAAGAQLVAFSGFSAVNYAREAYSADLDFASGFRASAYVSVAAIGTQMIFDRRAAAGAYWQMYVDSAGKIVANMSDGTTTRSATSAVAYTGVGFVKASM